MRRRVDDTLNQSDDRIETSPYFALDEAKVLWYNRVWTDLRVPIHIQSCHPSNPSELYILVLTSVTNLMSTYNTITENP